jgi:hypothetical protein
MTKCLDTIQLLRFISDPLAQGNADIVAHIFACKKCWDALNELQDNIADCNYIPEEGDKELTEQVVNKFLEKKSIWEKVKSIWEEGKSMWKDYKSIWKEWSDGFLAIKSASSRPVYASSQSSTSSKREVNEVFPISFDSLEEDSIYEWHVVLYYPDVDSMSIRINIAFPLLSKDFQGHKTLYLHGLELPIEDGKASVSLEEFLKSLEEGKCEVYIKFSGNSDPSYGKINIRQNNILKLS